VTPHVLLDQKAIFGEKFGNYGNKIKFKPHFLDSGITRKLNVSKYSSNLHWSGNCKKWNNDLYCAWF